jgi:putative transposase
MLSYLKRCVASDADQERVQAEHLVIRRLARWNGRMAEDADLASKARFEVSKFGNWTIEIVRRMADAVGFELLPRRWVVERTLAWLNRNRRLAKDFEATIASANAWLYLASVQLNWRVTDATYTILSRTLSTYRVMNVFSL